MSKLPKKILFAAGGTGGHLFPAQSLAEELLKQKPNIEVFFAAAKLSQTSYFDKEKFAFRDIQSMSPFRGGPLKILKSIVTLFRGIRESLKLLKEQKPDLVIGFGSFHSFPVLCAAVLKKIPMVLFESNAIPGRVIRLFSRRALFTGVYFPMVKNQLKGKVCEVEIPKKEMHISPPLDKHKARLMLQLEPDRFTLLIFGGSQGAKKMNQYFLEFIPLLQRENLSVQCIHFTGNKEMTATLTALYQSLSIPCYVRDFEPRMNIAWSAADLAICRSGAMTLSELLHYEVPAILIPYPFAADQHQLHNALFFENEIGCAKHFAESSLSGEGICDALAPFAKADSELKEGMRKAIVDYKAKQKKADLNSLILEIIEKK